MKIALIRGQFYIDDVLVYSPGNEPHEITFTCEAVEIKKVKVWDRMLTAEEIKEFSK